jgi:hypothetical protein
VTEDSGVERQASVQVGDAHGDGVELPQQGTRFRGEGGDIVPCPVTGIDQLEDLGGRAHVTEAAVDGAQRRVVRFVGHIRVGVGDHDDPVAEGARVACRRFAAHAGHGARDEHGVHTLGSEQVGEGAAPREERARRRLLYPDVVGSGVEPGPEPLGHRALAPGRRVHRRDRRTVKFGRPP